MNNFEFICDNYLEDLSQELEDFDEDSNLDIDYSDGILNIVIENTSETYVINRHSASGKIWYSSPVSGADYFSYDEIKQEFISDKNKELKTKLFNELKELV